MQTFLGIVSQALLSRNIPLENQVVVLPTQRAASFVKQWLCRELKENSWLPRFTTLNSWAEEVSGLHSADQLHLKFACFEAYQKVMGHAGQDLSGFFSWVDVLLGDFNDIDGHLIAPEVIFKELKDYTDIEHFSFLNEPLSGKQENYRNFWKAIPEIHKLLKENLLKDGLGYPGYIMQQAAERWPAFAEKNPDLFVTVAGFNALSGAERKLLRQMRASEKAEVYFDTDAWYLSQKENHAGLFMRRSLADEAGIFIYNKLSLGEKPMKINLCESSNRTDQADMVAAVLSQIPQEELAETALVLADESLLIPILNRLPPNITESNITMGINLGDTGFADWLRKLWDCHETGIYEKGDFFFRSDRLAAFLAHPVSRQLVRLTGTNSIENQNSPEQFIASEIMVSQASKAGISWAVPLFKPWNYDAARAIENLSESLAIITQLLSRPGDRDVEIRLISESVVLVSRVLAKTRAFPQFRDLRPSVLTGILQRALAAGSLALMGEPLKELQIMGLLETRALGFKNVVVCSANEDVLPRKAKIDSFIPFEIRGYHRLPGKKEKEAVYAYHFYRLLQHADAATLVYHTDTDDQKGGEASRYLLQLSHELSRANAQVNLKRISLSQPVIPAPETVLEIKKTPEVLDNIKRSIRNRLSASLINRYLDSPLEWYYGYVLRLKEPDEGTDLDSSTFGTLFHDTVEALHLPFLNKEIATEDFDQMLKVAGEELSRQFSINEKSRNHTYGLNRIHYEMAGEMLRNYLKSEKALIAAGQKLTYLNSEMKLDRVLRFEIDGESIEAVFTGSADSVERRDGQLGIVDFKTGNVKSSDLSLKEWSVESFSKHPKAFQLLLYNWLIRSKFDKETVDTQIISLPAPANRNLRLKRGIQTDEDEREFEAVLVEILNAMLDKSVDIVADEAFKYPVFE